MPQFSLNRTIDDEFGDSVSGVQPTYRPASFWSLDSSCDGCVLHADPKLAFNHTWHDSSQLPGTAPVSLTLDFVGTAVYVYCILPPITPNVVTSYNLNFTLDGASRGRYFRSPTSTTDYLYNVSVLSLESLPNTAHSLVISTDDSVDGSIFLFDYAVYTTVQGKPDIHPGVIAGGVFGAVFLLCLILSLVVFKWNQQRRRNRSVLPVVYPFSISSREPTATTGDSVASAQAPTSLVRQLPQTLDTVVSLQRDSDRSASGPATSSAMDRVESESHYAASPPDYSAPPPGYQIQEEEECITAQAEVPIRNKQALYLRTSRP